MNQTALLGALAVPILVVLLVLLSWHCCYRRPKSHRGKDGMLGSDTSGPSYAGNSTYHSYDRPNIPVPAYFGQGIAVPPVAVAHGYGPQAPVFNNLDQQAYPYGTPYHFARQTGSENIPPAPEPIYTPVPHPRPMRYGDPPPPATPTPGRRHSRRPREMSRSAARLAGSVTASSTSSAWSRPPFPFPPYATVEDEGEWVSARSAA